jgi:exosortase/archaeosortase family protein
LAAALFATFGISVLVWLAFAAAPTLLLRERAPATGRDGLIAVAVLAAILLPGAPFSWLALTALAGYMLLDRSDAGGEPASSPVRRAAWILLALSGTMLWGRLLLMGAGGPVLGADAVLIGWLSGTAQSGNTVQFADGSGFVWIAPGCSSLSNVSLAMLCWVLLAQWRNVPWSPRTIGWCGLACLAAIAVNVTRISLMVRYPEHFDLIHGPTGAGIASVVSLLAVVGVSAWGTGHAPRR